MQENTNNSASAQDVPQQIDLNLGVAIERIDSWLDSFIRLLPNIAVAVVVILIAYGLARLVARMIRSSSSHRDRKNLGEVLGGFIKWVILVTGFLLAATIVVPTLKPGDLVAGLGISSVAIGFAFKDILQNWLAGILILLRQPFEVGDQIEVTGYEGTVRRIEARATIIKTYDGQRVVVPNSDIYTNAVLVKTAYETRRSEYDIGIGYSDDIAEAHEIIKTAVASAEGVAPDPAPQTLVTELAASWVTIRARWWTASTRADIVQTRSNVIQAVKDALDDAGIDMPYDTQVQLWHDQSEDGDGDRATQREGWPAPKEGEGTKPRWRSEIEAREGKKQAG